MGEKSNSSSGIGLPGVLFVVFLVLKLTKVIDWSWWWVTAPLWGCLAIVLAILLGAGALVGMAVAIGSAGKRAARGGRRDA